MSDLGLLHLPSLRLYRDLEIQKNDKLEFPCIILTHIAMGVVGTDQVEAEGNKTRFEGSSIEVAVDYWLGTRGSGNAASCSMRH